MQSRPTRRKKTNPLFQQRLLRWYYKSQRDLPWRLTHDPYAIAVSEMMLQQTQVDRVIPKFLAWMEQFPDVQTLAAARTADIIASWQGLGYNRRALYLQRIARAVVREHDGEFPRTVEGLRSLPGIGPYTAGAIMSFAFKQSEPIVDTNVQRVIGRIFIGYKKLLTATPESLWELARTLIPKNSKAYFFNQGLMDFGSLVCTARKPDCEHCPMQSICKSYPSILQAKPEELRVKKVANERQYFGQPQRIWRGKILRYLHTPAAANGATLNAIGKAIQSDFDATRLPWLTEVVTALESEGFVRRANRKVYLP
jgi:A/G-specific adenine glycosylase